MPSYEEYLIFTTPNTCVTLQVLLCIFSISYVCSKHKSLTWPVATQSCTGVPQAERLFFCMTGCNATQQNKTKQNITRFGWGLSLETEFENGNHLKALSGIIIIILCEEKIVSLTSDRVALENTVLICSHSHAS